jgi:histidine ammonia-lyase
LAITVDGRSLNVAAVIEVAERGAAVRTSPNSLRQMKRFRTLLEDKLSRGEVVYGVNTGFGSLSDKVIRPENLEELQLNLIRSHSAGVGSPLPTEVVRAAMLIRLNSLLNGNSAVRKEVAELIVGMLNRGVTPLVPEFGSLGACLAADSSVYTNPSGPKRISDLTQGDKVYSFTGGLKKVRVPGRARSEPRFRYELEGTLTTNRVVRKIDSGTRQTYRLHTRTRELVCTDNHPLLRLAAREAGVGTDADYTLEWASLATLRPGDSVLALKQPGKEEPSRSPAAKVNVGTSNPDFYFDDVVRIEPDRVQGVYDIEVEGSHNFVSEGLVVHNSGDLVPSAHMALTMLGEGKAYRRGKLMDSARALELSRLKPIRLEAKEGLSLINGTQFTTALSCVAVHRGATLLKAANSALAVTAEALGACSQSFDERLVGLKLDQGQGSVAREIRCLLRGSRRVRSEPVPQDPYSIRCAPQVHGALKDALGFAEKITADELNSVSDNPVLLEDGSVLHGGNFHAQPVAMALDLMSISLSYLGVISLARIHYLLSKTPSESKYMARRPGLESGLMILEYTATALANDNAKNVHPESSYPANVSGGVEDHASHGVNAGVKCLVVAANVSRILAVELICASNVLGSNEGGTSEHARKVRAFVRARSPLLRGDRAQGEEVELLADEILAGRLP